jgi:hypothetical protein
VPDEAPETFVRVLDEEGEALFTSDQSFRHQAGEVEVIDAAIEGSRVPDSRSLKKELSAALNKEARRARTRKDVLAHKQGLRTDPMRLLPGQ